MPDQSRLAEALLQKEVNRNAFCNKQGLVLRFLLSSFVLAALLALALCTWGQNGEQLPSPAITMASRAQLAQAQQFPGPVRPGQTMALQRSRIWQSTQPVRGQHFMQSAVDAEKLPAQMSPEVQQPHGIKGGLHAGDSRVREAASLGTNEYSHADWRQAVEQLTPHTEFAYACRVEGTIPPELDGTLFRNGPGKYERGGVAYSNYLDGDGLVLSIDFDPTSNKAFARARFVRTDEFMEEDKVDAILYRATFGNKPGGIMRNAFDLHTKNVANTNVVFWGGRVHALFEAGMPYELDPASLKTLCTDDMEGCVPYDKGLFVSTSFEPVDRAAGLGGWAFTAHPHIDPQTERLCGWAYQSLALKNALAVRFAEWDANWTRTALREYEIENCQAASHDFGVTASNYVMVQNRLDIDTGPYLLGLKPAADALVSRPDLPVLVHIIPRAKDAPAVVLEGPRESFEIHVAFTHDGPPIGSTPDPDADAHIVTLYTAGWDRLAPGSFLSEWGNPGHHAPDFNNIPRTVLWRYVIDKRSGSVTRTLAPGCENINIDHPHVNPRFEGSAACRYVYALISNEVSTSGPSRGYVRLDLLTGTREVWYAPTGRMFVEEPVIVEKKTAQGNSNDTGDVWLLGMCSDIDEPDGQSSLLVLDGARLADGPVARIRLDHHITHGLHGSFAPGFHTSKTATPQKQA